MVECSDLILIPARPSPHDLRAVGGTIELVAAIALSQHGTVAPTTVHQRVDFANSMIDGRTVGELDINSNFAKEIADLWIYVNAGLRKTTKENVNV